MVGRSGNGQLAVLKPSFIPLCWLVIQSGFPWAVKLWQSPNPPNPPIFFRISGSLTSYWISLTNRGPPATAQLTYSTRSVPERVAPAAASAALDAADVPTAALEEAWKQTPGRRARSKPFQSRSPAGVGYPRMVRKSWFTRIDKALRTGEFPWYPTFNFMGYQLAWLPNVTKLLQLDPPKFGSQLSISNSSEATLEIFGGHTATPDSRWCLESPSVALQFRWCRWSPLLGRHLIPPPSWKSRPGCSENLAARSGWWKKPGWRLWEKPSEKNRLGQQS